MSTTEEVKEVNEVVKGEVVKKVEVAKEEHQETEIEAKAREMGWNPDKEGVEDGKWIGAEEYVARAPLFEKNRKLSRKVKELESSVNALKTHYTKIESIAYEKALESLKEKKIKAMDEFDHKTVARIDEEIQDMKAPRPQPQNIQDPNFLVWVEKNPWYEADDELKSFADKAGLAFAKATPDADPEEVYKYAERRVREKFPDKFRNPNREKPSSVEGSTKTQTKSSRPTWSSLPEHFQQAGNKFVRSGIMTKEQYIDDLIKLGEVK